MKPIFFEQHRAEFSVKAMCRVLLVARNSWYAWRLHHHLPGPRQQFRLICDAVVRKALTDAKPRYGAPRLADELPEYTICIVRDCGQKPHGSSAQSAIVNMVCRYRKIC